MFFEYAYELVAAIFLLMILLCYRKKNWLDLRSNRVFNFLLNTLMIFTVADMAVRRWSTTIGAGNFGLKYTLGIITCLTLVWSFAIFYIYFLVLTDHIRDFFGRKFFLLMSPALLASVLIILSPWNHFVFYYDEAGIYQNGAGSGLIFFVACMYAAGVCILAFISPKHIRRGDAWICTVMCALNIGLVVFQTVVLKNRYLLLFYAEDFMILMLYLLFENMDRFMDRISGGFSRDGFRKVLDEKFRYKQRFGCLFISIQNYQNITSICDRQDVYQIMGQIGAILRRCGGEHNQFHIHGADFAVIRKREEELLKTYFRASAELPKRIRVNNRNIPITYGYYMLTLDEAAYDQSEFFKMVSNMKKMLREQTDAGGLIRYEGGVKKTIDMELQIGRELKKMLNARHCDLVFYPIIDFSNGKCHALETKIYMTRENGEMIPEEVIWSVVKEMGYTRELGWVLFESMLQCAAEEKFLERGVNKMAINISPLHISSADSLKTYREMAQKYNFPLERLCLEMTEDLSVSHETVRDNMSVLNELGVSMILDRYGESVCNLQHIMQMPFNVVKICRQMVHRFCSGESEVLQYQIQMLRDNGWNICLEGIDNMVQLEKVEGMDVTFLQGKYYSHPITPERLHAFVEEI